MTSTNGGNDLRSRNSGKIHGAKFKVQKQLDSEKNKLINDSTQNNIDFFLKILPLKDDELAMSEM